MNAQDNLKVAKWVEEGARLKRKAFLITREGVDKMTADEMRIHLVTCDGRGKEVKAIILDMLIEKMCADAVEAEIARQNME